MLELTTNAYFATVSFFKSGLKNTYIYKFIRKLI